MKFTLQHFFICVLFGLSSSTLGWAFPAQILIVRHGEKPAVGDNLSPQGWDRANALPDFFVNYSGFDDKAPLAPPKGVEAYKKIAGIFGMAPETPDQGTLRCVETVFPTSVRLKLTINQDFRKKDLDAIAAYIKNNRAFDGKTIVISYEHDAIPALAKALGMKAPPPWNGEDVFDRVWSLRFDKKGNLTMFHDFPQNILPTDDGSMERWQMGNPSKSEIKKTRKKLAKQLKKDPYNVKLNDQVNPCGMHYYVDSIVGSGE